MQLNHSVSRLSTNSHKINKTEKLKTFLNCVIYFFKKGATLPRGHIYNDRAKNSMSEYKRINLKWDGKIIIRGVFARRTSKAFEILRFARKPWAVFISIRSAVQHTRWLHELPWKGHASLWRALLHPIRWVAREQCNACNRRRAKVRKDFELVNSFKWQHNFLNPQQSWTDRRSIFNVQRKGSQPNLEKS